jgi:molybdopterin synthase sulfur carrier subunit
MEWTLFAHLRDAVGKKQVEVPLEGEVTVERALNTLLEEHPDLRAEVFEDGELAGHIRLLVDGEDPFQSGNGLATTVDSDTELALFPPVTGG